MRNKLTRRKNVNVSAYQSKSSTQCDVIVLSETSCSGNEEVLQEDSLYLIDGKDGARADGQVTTIHQLQSEEKKGQLEVKLAPIFIRTTHHTRSKDVCKDNLHRDPEKGNMMPKYVSPPRHGFHSVSKHLSPHCLKQRREPISSTHLSISTQQSCLEEIRKSNPTFSTRRVFRSLQQKHGENFNNVLSPEVGLDDVLWTEKYSPLHSSEVIGNSTSVKKLHSWLKKWKCRVVGDDRIKRVERKRQQDKDPWDSGDFKGEAGSDEMEEPLSTTLLITGPPGVGKTASVYACALELGFKVFEVNCSSQRSGRCVLAQLKEVTQSHLVEPLGKEALKPAYFNNYNPHGSSNKPDVISGRNTSKTTVTCTLKWKPAPNQDVSLRRRKKPNQGVVTLANLLKSKAKADYPLASGLSSEEQVRETLRNPSQGTEEMVDRTKRTATSLVLFEEVDVVFGDDVGFLAAIKTLMMTTKRPVVLTTNDPSFKERFESNMEEIIFKTPSAADVCSYLRLVCLMEKAWTELDDVTRLLAGARGDVRRCLLQLQFVVKSAAGRAPQKTHSPKESVGSRDGKAEGNLNGVPLLINKGYLVSVPCINALTKQNILSLLKCQSWTDPENKLLKVLTESWRRHLPLFYSNLELLLPLPAGTQRTTNRSPDKGPNPGIGSEQLPPAIQPQSQQSCQNFDLKTASTKKRTSVRSYSRLTRRRGLATPLERRSSHDTHRTCQTEGDTSVNGALFPSQGSTDKTGEQGIKLATHQALDALTHFVDLMSYLDATVSTTEPHVSGPCPSKDFFWTGAEVKDSLLDQSGEGEEDDEGGQRNCWRQQERLLEIQAAVEGLGFHAYWMGLSKVCNDAQTCSQEVADVKWAERLEGMSLPGLAHGSVSGLGPLCQPSMVQQRFGLSRAVLQNRVFGLLGNRRAVCLDYMPTLRSICRYQTLQQGLKHGRCQHYLRSIHLGLSKSTIHLLANTELLS